MDGYVQVILWVAAAGCLFYYLKRRRNRRTQV
jgi:uncharacterized membrane protein